MNSKSLKFFEDDKENIDPVSGMRAGLAPAPVHRFRSFPADEHANASAADKVAVAGPDGNTAMSMRILRDITPDPVSSEDEEEKLEGSSPIPKVSGARKTDVVILADENSIPSGPSFSKQTGPATSSLQKKTQGHIVASYGKAVKEFKPSKGKSRKQNTNMKGKTKKRGLRRADGNVRRGIRSVR